MIGVLKNTDLTQEQKEYVETVESSGEALLDLVNDILDFSKIGTCSHLPRLRVYIDQLVRRVWQNCTRRDRV